MRLSIETFFSAARVDFLSRIPKICFIDILIKGRRALNNNAGIP